VTGFDELGAPGTAPKFEPLAVGDETTVVSVFEPAAGRDDSYQSEAELEDAFIAQLVAQAYGRLSITNSADLEANLRAQLEKLNGLVFTDGEWARFFDQNIAARNEGILEKTARMHEDHVQVLERDDGTVKNVALIDKSNIHNNTVQVINQYEAQGKAAGAVGANRYDVTVLVNGLPLVHVELKRRGVPLKEAFNQIDRYQRESFWAGSGLFEYVQLFVISNGTHTKYYANTTRARRIAEATAEGGRRSKSQTSNSFEFTSWWTDARNRRIGDLTEFTKTFFAKRTLLSILTRYCVFDVTRTLLVMRPYQIVAAEQILQRIVTSANHKQLGTLQACGYIWHTTGSGKTLTSFKTAQLAARLPGVDKVIFVVDRRDLDYQTIREYERFEKGAVDGTRNTAHLKRRLEDPDSRIIVTTIQKLARFVTQNQSHAIYSGHLVLVFDECHRSQFGDMSTAIRKAFKNYNLFGFTGTPIFAENAGSVGLLRTTEQVFGDRLHTYTIVDAINDENVLPFRVSYHNTVKASPGATDKQVEAIDTDEVLMHPDRIEDITGYVLDTFDAKTKRTTGYSLAGKRVRGFNSMFAVGSIPMLRLYYDEFAKQQAKRKAANGSYQPLKIATIFSYAANEEAGGLLDDEEMDTGSLDQSSRDFLERAIQDYNEQFGTSFDTSAAKFENYYKDLAGRIKDRQVDLVLVVNMFLTGFDATTLNTLWVDKSLRQHGLIQAFSRTNRILNSVKAYGNIVCFRNLEERVNDALSLFGNKDAKGIVLLKPYDEYYDAYKALTSSLTAQLPAGQDPVGESAEKQFIVMFGEILRLRNILTSFDEFEGDTLLSPRQLQDYQSVYLGLHDKHRGKDAPERESILDDVVFEIELIKQVEVNIDYILLLVQRWRETRGDGQDKETKALRDIKKAVDASPSLRSKSDLFMAFVDKISVSPGEDWSTFVTARRDAELEALIAAERLKGDETRELVANALRDGAVPTAGTAITKILPPMSRFAAGGDHATKKQRVIGKLLAFFERYAGV
jgi:type I restriction enzyme R subunit